MKIDADERTRIARRGIVSEEAKPWLVAMIVALTVSSIGLLVAMGPWPEGRPAPRAGMTAPR